MPPLCQVMTVGSVFRNVSFMSGNEGGAVSLGMPPLCQVMKRGGGQCL